MSSANESVCRSGQKHPEPLLSPSEKLQIATVGAGALAVNLAIYVGAAKGNAICIAYTAFQIALTMATGVWVAWGAKHDVT